MAATVVLRRDGAMLMLSRSVIAVTFAVTAAAIVAIGAPFAGATGSYRERRLPIEHPRRSLFGYVAAGAEVSVEARPGVGWCTLIYHGEVVEVASLGCPLYRCNERPTIDVLWTFDRFTFTVT